MYLQDVDDITYCRYFRVTLKRVTQNWISRLMPGNITYFTELCDFEDRQKEGIGPRK